jgi:hypothetical protein
MPRILESVEISASRDRVWEIISDIDHEPDYWWGTRSVKNISRDGNIIVREIYQRFSNRLIQQKVTLRPKTVIEIDYLKGITQGTKHLRLTSRIENSQELVAEWNIRFTGSYRLASPFIARHVRKGTREALQRIKIASEGKISEKPLAESSK